MIITVIAVVVVIMLAVIYANQYKFQKGGTVRVSICSVYWTVSITYTLYKYDDIIYTGPIIPEQCDVHIFNETWSIFMESKTVRFKVYSNGGLFDLSDSSTVTLFGGKTEYVYFSV